MSSHSAFGYCMPEKCTTADNGPMSPGRLARAVEVSVWGAQLHSHFQAKWQFS